MLGYSVLRLLTRWWGKQAATQVARSVTSLNHCACSCACACACACLLCARVCGYGCVCDVIILACAFITVMGEDVTVTKCRDRFGRASRMHSSWARPRPLPVCCVRLLPSLRWHGSQFVLPHSYIGRFGPDPRRRTFPHLSVAEIILSCFGVRSRHLFCCFLIPGRIGEMQGILAARGVAWHIDLL